MRLGWPGERIFGHCRFLLFLFPFLAATNAIPIFREAPATESGITWIHQNGRSNHRYLPETTGAGVAIFDYNNDGWMDILLVNSGASSFYQPPTPPRTALYRNNHDGTFTDVAKEAGITTDLYGMGVAIGDYDGDGHPDIYISGIGKRVLYHNNGNGTFTDVTEASGIAASQWGTLRMPCLAPRPRPPQRTHPRSHVRFRWPRR